MAEPANRQTNTAGGKYYVHPVTGERFDSVTTILDLVDKAALKMWAGLLSADMALEHLPQLVAAGLVEDCKNTYNRCYQKHGRENRCERCPCGQCTRCWHRRIAYKHQAESSRRAAEGGEVHEAIDFWIHSGGGMVNLTEAAKPYFAAFLQWARDYHLLPRRSDDPGSWEQTEVTLLNRDHMYAGTSDGAIWLRRGTSRLADEKLDLLGGLDQALIRVDYKTREKPDEKLYGDHVLQGVGYDRCSVAMLPDGSEAPAPKTDACAVLQMRPGEDGTSGAYSFKLMPATDDEFDAFIGVLSAYRWFTGRGKTAFSEDRALLGVPLPTVLRASLDARVPVTDVDHPVAARLVTGATPATRTRAEIVDELTSIAPPSATAKADPFALVNNPDQAAADAKRPARRPPAKKAAASSGNATLDSLRDFDPGRPDFSRRNEQIPF